MARPLYPPSRDREIAALRRKVASLSKRGVGHWIYVGDPDEPTFQNGWANSGSGLVPMRFRGLVGGGIEIQGSVTGGSPGTAIFTLPSDFAPSHELRLAASNDAMNFVVFRILANGDVISG